MICEHLPSVPNSYIQTKLWFRSEDVLRVVKHIAIEYFVHRVSVHIFRSIVVCMEVSFIASDWYRRSEVSSHGRSFDLDSSRHTNSSKDRSQLRSISHFFLRLVCKVSLNKIRPISIRSLQIFDHRTKSRRSVRFGRLNATKKHQVRWRENFFMHVLEKKNRRTVLTGRSKSERERGKNIDSHSSKDLRP